MASSVTPARTRCHHRLRSGQCRLVRRGGPCRCLFDCHPRRESAFGVLLRERAQATPTKPNARSRPTEEMHPCHISQARRKAPAPGAFPTPLTTQLLLWLFFTSPSPRSLQSPAPPTEPPAQPPAPPTAPACSAAPSSRSTSRTPSSSAQTPACPSSDRRPETPSS